MWTNKEGCKAYPHHLCGDSYWDSMHIKVYEEGKTGDYECICCHCEEHFIGRKRDVNCGKCKNKG